MDMSELFPDIGNSLKGAYTLWSNALTEQGKGVRPQSDEALAAVRQAFKDNPRGTPAAAMLQAAVRAPGTTTVDTGHLYQSPGSLHSASVFANPLMPERAAMLIDPKALKKAGTTFGQKYQQTTVPHEFTHSTRDVKQLAGKTPKVDEETIARWAVEQPFFDPNRPPTMDELPWYKDELEKTLR